ncbi:MAG: LysR substrate-binding domain-containing protein [Luteibaculaceae bacterium]
MQYTLTQLHYAITLADTGSFVIASDYCLVSQPTLSIQIKKLEESVGFSIFNRASQPVKPTRAGAVFLQYAKEILSKARALDEEIKDIKGKLSGELRIGIIPTLAPYILPGLLKEFSALYPEVSITVSEIITSDIIELLENDRLDIGLLVTPLHDKKIIEYPLFYEEIVLYRNKNYQQDKAIYWEPSQLNKNDLWLLQEGHCFRNQVVNLCEFKNTHSNIKFDSGSIETLLKMVEHEGGYTLIPELAALNLDAERQKNVIPLGEQHYHREVSLVVSKLFAKHKLIERFKQLLLKRLPEKLKNRKPANVVDIFVSD